MAHCVKNSTENKAAGKTAALKESRLHGLLPHLASGQRQPTGETDHPAAKKRYLKALELLRTREIDPWEFTGSPDPGNIRAVRFYLDLTLAEVALLLGKRSQLTVRKWESGATRIPQAHWDQLCALVSEAQPDILLRIYGSADKIPRRNGAGLSVAKIQPDHWKRPVPLEAVTGATLRELRTAAFLPVPAVAALAFGRQGQGLLEPLAAETALYRLEAGKRVSCGAAAAVLDAIQTLLHARRGIALDALERSHENLRMLRKSFGLSQAELARLFGSESHGLVYWYESTRSAIRMPAKRWEALITAMAAIEQGVPRIGDADAAITRVAASIARHRERLTTVFAETVPTVK